MSETTTPGLPPYPAEYAHLVEPIGGDPAGKHLLSMHQLDYNDIAGYIHQARSAESILNTQGGISLLPFKVLKAVMRQKSTRTGGSMTTAMVKLGGNGELISGMDASSEGKGESIEHSWEAFTTQSDILGIRMAEEWGPAVAAERADKAYEDGDVPNLVPVINLGDGTNEHPTQALGDLFTMARDIGIEELEGKTLVIVGAADRYRAFHSLTIGAVAVRMNIITVESEVAKLPQNLVSLARHKIERTGDLDEAMQVADFVYVGRKPDEYEGQGQAEKDRSRLLGEFYDRNFIDFDRLQRSLPPDARLLHPRPINGEIDPSVESDPRVIDVKQMFNMIPMRMAIIAMHMGKTLI